MIHPVVKPPCHKLWLGAKAGIENNCLVDPTNLVSSNGRDSLRKNRAGETPAEYGLRVYTIAENVKTGEKHHRTCRRASSLHRWGVKA